MTLVSAQLLSRASQGDASNDLSTRPPLQYQQPGGPASILSKKTSTASPPGDQVDLGRADAAWSGQESRSLEDLFFQTSIGSHSESDTTARMSCFAGRRPGDHELKDAPKVSIAVSNSAELPQMKEPHISTLYDKQDVMSKRFGVSQQQALQTQALIRLGVTDEDVSIAERLMATTSLRDSVQSKSEIILGYTVKEMSLQKAFDILGVSGGMVEEDTARRLGGLGHEGWTFSYGGEDQGGPCGDGDSCRGFFAKRRRAHSQENVALGICLPGEIAFGPTQLCALRATSTSSNE